MSLLKCDSNTQLAMFPMSRTPLGGRTSHQALLSSLRVGYLRYDQKFSMSSLAPDVAFRLLQVESICSVFYFLFTFFSFLDSKVLACVPHTTLTMAAHTCRDDQEYDCVESQSVWQSIWLDNKGAFLILCAELFGSCTDAIVRFLQQGEHGMHPFQVIVARMGVTFLLSTIYMWWTKVPDFPFGHPDVRFWLVLRSLFGFGGLFCLYCELSRTMNAAAKTDGCSDSVHYLPLAEATVLRFLVPTVTAMSCAFFLGELFTMKEFIAGLIALVGVIMIAHPSGLSGASPDDVNVTLASPADEVSPLQRFIAIVVSLVGIFGAAGAYTTIRVIGHRAHALMSVNYFAFIGTVGSTFALIVLPGMSFTMPYGAQQWFLLLILGIFGFGLQFLLTAGLQLDRSSKATSMLYTQILFALSFDWAIWGVLPDGLSFLGGAIVIASTLWSALQKSHPAPKVQDSDDGKIVDEESALLINEDREREEGDFVRRSSVSA